MQRDPCRVSNVQRIAVLPLQDLLGVFSLPLDSVGVKAAFSLFYLQFLKKRRICGIIYARSFIRHLRHNRRNKQRMEGA